MLLILYQTFLIYLQIRKNDYSVSNWLNNVAGSFRELNQLDSAKFYYNIGAEYSEKEGRQEGVAASMLNFSSIEYEEGLYKKAILKLIIRYST